MQTSSATPTFFLFCYAKSGSLYTLNESVEFVEYWECLLRRENRIKLRLYILPLEKFIEENDK